MPTVWPAKRRLFLLRQGPARFVAMAPRHLSNGSRDFVGSKNLRSRDGTVRWCGLANRLLALPFTHFAPFLKSPRIGPSMRLTAFFVCGRIPCR